MSESWQIIDLPAIQDPRGDLTFVEGGNQIPFEIARVFYIYNAPADAERGGHAHHRLKQAIFALSGSFRLRLDNGSHKADFWLRNPRQGVLVNPLVWRDMDKFSQGTVCMVLASRRYDEDDYIRDHASFLETVGGKSA